MSDLREKVAREYCEQAGVPSDFAPLGSGRDATAILAETFDGWHAAIKEAGYAIVPVEPTDAMIETGQDVRDDDYDGKWAVNIYRAMLSAAQEGEE